MAHETEISEQIDQNEFGKLVKTKRKAKGWSQEALAANALGNPDRRGHISNYENGNSKPNPFTVQSLCSALEIDRSEVPISLRWISKESEEASISEIFALVGERQEYNGLDEAKIASLVRAALTEQTQEHLIGIREAIDIVKSELAESSESVTIDQENWFTKLMYRKVLTSLVVASVAIAALYFFGTSQFWADAPIEMQGVELELGCGSPNEGEDALITSDQEIDQISNFASFLEAHDGKPVFASIRIQKNCNVCGCRRLDQSPSWDNEDREITGREVLFDSEEPSTRTFGTTKVQKEGFEIFSLASTPYVLVSLPRESHLDGIDRMRIGRHGDLLSYNGVFISNFYGTVQGTRIGYLKPVEMTQGFFQEISCYQDLMDRNVIEPLSERTPSSDCRGAKFWSSDEVNDFFGFDQIIPPEKF